MRILKKVKIVKDEIDKVYCNSCGKCIEKDSYEYFHEYLHIEKSWGYTSNKDGELHSFDLCENCYDKFISSFEIPPEISK